MSWTQKELEELYQKANARGLADPAFRARLETDAKRALEEISGKELPEGFSLNMVDGDRRYAAAYFTPDFTGGELSLSDLRAVAGGAGEQDFGGDEGNVEVPNYGISFALIVSVCGAAAAVGPCPADACGAQGGCAGDVCGAAACGAAAGCAGEACGLAATGVTAGCAGEVCAGAATGVEGGCIGDACGVAATGVEFGCMGEVCGGAATGAEAVCAGAACGAAATGASGICQGATCGAEATGYSEACPTYSCGTAVAGNG